MDYELVFIGIGLWIHKKEVHNRIKQVLDILVKDYGAEVVNISIPHLEIISKAHTVMILSEWVEGD